MLQDAAFAAFKASVLAVQAQASAAKPSFLPGEGTVQAMPAGAVKHHQSVWRSRSLRGITPCVLGSAPHKTCNYICKLVCVPNH